MVAAPSEVDLFSDLCRRLAKRQNKPARTTQPTPRTTPMLIPVLAPGLKVDDVLEGADEAVGIVAPLVGVGL